MNDLKKIRSDIDKLDHQMLTLIKKRLDLVIKIGKIKKENNLKIRDLKREKEVLEKIIRKANTLSLSPIFVKKIWQIFFKESYKSEI